jgi:predicted DNA-binding protein
MPDLTCHFSDKQYERLDKLAKLDNRTKANIIRTALHRYANAMRKIDENGEQVKFPLDSE